jgi:sensor histidine kinase YesM
MTTLQQINTLLKEYIKMPLNSFYKLIITIFILLFLVVAITTPFSFSKLISLALLFFLLIIVGLLTFGNSQEQKITKSKKDFKEKKELVTKESEIQEKTIQQNSIKDFIA